MSQHIKKAAKQWTCARCQTSIDKGVRHFCVLGASLPYGRYITAMVEKRLHLGCLQQNDVCCSNARQELNDIGHVIVAP